MKATCTHLKADNTACEANPQKDRPTCWMHDPSVSPEIKRLAKQKGGKANKPIVVSPQPTVQIKTSSDVLKLLEETANGVRSGTLDVRIATGLTYISSMMLKAISQSNELDMDDDDKVIVIQWADSGDLEIGPKDRKEAEALQKKAEK